MPQKRKESDPEFLPGHTRRKIGYESTRDNRNVSKQLLSIKCKSTRFFNKHGKPKNPTCKLQLLKHD